MHDDGSRTRRSVVPRWRPLAHTPKAELRSSLRRSNPTVGALNSLIRKAKFWQETRSLVSASDLLDAALHFNDRQIGREAANQILSTSDAVQSLQQSAGRYLSLELAPPGDLRPTPVERRQNIRTLKARLVQQPRDAITAVELSRLYALSGQHEQAVAYMERGLRLSPDDRYVLRSACRLFTHLGDRDRALQTLWVSDAVRHDPWVQAAEVAVADQTGRTPRWGTKLAKRLAVSSKVGTEFSELAIGLASLEQKNGAKKKVVRGLIEGSLAAPTENALAQAVWMDERGNFALATDSLLNEVSMANEANALASHDRGQYSFAVAHAFRWAADQPFSKRPYLFGASCATLHLDDSAVAEEFSRLGLEVYPNDPALSNGLLVALAYQGRLEEAERHLAPLERARSDAEQAPFYFAARGLLEFRRGHIETGRRFYESAVEAAKKSEDKSLPMHAFTFWIEQEAFARSISLEEWQLTVAELERRFDQLKGFNGRELKRTWDARKPKIDALVRQPLLHDAHSAAKPQLDHNLNFIVS